MFWDTFQPTIAVKNGYLIYLPVGSSESVILLWHLLIRPTVLSTVRFLTGCFLHTQVVVLVMPNDSALINFPSFISAKIVAIWSLCWFILLRNQHRQNPPTQTLSRYLKKSISPGTQETYQFKKWVGSNKRCKGLPPAVLYVEAPAAAIFSTWVVNLSFRWPFWSCFHRDCSNCSLLFFLHTFCALRIIILNSLLEITGRQVQIQKQARVSTRHKQNRGWIRITIPGNRTKIIHIQKAWHT